MDKFDRPRQRLFLQGLYDAYPEELTNEQLGTPSLFTQRGIFCHLNKWKNPDATAVTT